MLKYFYIDDISKLQCGPFTTNELLRKNIRPGIMVWRSGMADWAEAGTLQELNFLFDSKIPVPQEQKEPEQPPAPRSQPQQQPQQQYNTQPQPDNTQSQAYNNRQQQAPLNRQQQYQYYYDEQRKWDGIVSMPKNWLVESILLTIFCCSPVSLVGIFYAVRVEALYGKRDYEGAQDASDKAKLWTLWGIAFLPAVYIILLFIAMLV